MKTWKCRDGRVLEIKKMDTDHLRNTIAMLRSNGFVTSSEFDGMMRSHNSLSGEFAQMAAEREIAGARYTPALEHLEDELRKREHLK